MIFAAPVGHRDMVTSTRSRAQWATKGESLFNLVVGPVHLEVVVENPPVLFVPHPSTTPDH